MLDFESKFLQIKTGPHTEFFLVVVDKLNSPNAITVTK